MKIKQTLKVLPLLAVMQVGFAETAAERLEQGIQFQVSEENLSAAVAEYEAVLKAAAKSHKLIAEARYRLAECYLGLGQTKAMETQISALREEFPRDNRWVIKAEKLAPAPWGFEGAPWVNGRLHTYGVKIPNGDTIGHFLIANRISKKASEEVWESIAIRTAGGRSLSNVTFSQKDYKSLSARWFMDLFGDVSVTFKKDGKVLLIDSETGEQKDEYDHSKSRDAQIPMFENEQAIQMLRVLKQEVGTQQKTMIYAAHNGGMQIPFDLEVTEHVDITVPAGTFSCAKIETSIKQTFYVSRGERRELVRIDMGAAKIDLLKSEGWDVSQDQKLQSREFGATLRLPGNMFFLPPVDNQEVYRLEVWSSDFAGTWGMLELNKKANLLPEGQKGSRELAELLHKGYAKNYEEFKVLDGWDELEIDGVKAVGMRVTGKKGELNDHGYQVHAVGDELSLTFRLHYAKPDEERAIARAKEIVKTIRW